MKSLNLPYEHFADLDLRVGTVTKAESIPKSKKLLNLEVNFGSVIGTKTILAGIAESYSPEFIKGEVVIAVLNLAPREMMGIISEGMLLAAHGRNGTKLLTIDKEVPDGAEVG